MSQASGITLAATTRAHMLRAAVAAGTLLLSGCASLAAERAGPALATSSGPARSRCEATAWVEAAPALAEAEAAHQPGARSAPLLVRGEALFRPGAKEPLPLPSLLASLPRHDRAQQHLERYEDLEIPKQKVRVLYTVGAVLGLLGAGMAAG
ncbi:MAG: hypothetical protein FJ125_12560, partial [Deltaproteobacteria bacterium]|nr:hypothetical protein [Deltaproteobacteria bacterium]